MLLQKCSFAKTKPKHDTVQPLLHARQYSDEHCQTSIRIQKLPAPQSIIHALALFSKENKLLQSSNPANRLRSYWRKEHFGKIINNNNIVATILLIPMWLGWVQNQHPHCHYWADFCSCHFLFGYSWLVVQGTGACQPKAHLEAMHFFSSCSIHSFQFSYSFVLSSFCTSLHLLLLSPWSCSTLLPEFKVLKTFLKDVPARDRKVEPLLYK